MTEYIYRSRSNNNMGGAKKNYTNGLIYKITNTIDNMIYIGSTTIDINERYIRHLQDSLFKPSKLYQHMRSLGKDNFKIELIEKCPCSTEKELTARESHFIRETQSHIFGLNVIVPQRTAKERYNDQPEDVRKEKQRIQDEKKKLKRQNDPVARCKYNERMREYNAKRKSEGI